MRRYAGSAPPPLSRTAPPATPAYRRCRCIVLMLDRPPSSSPANVGRSAGAGAVLAHRVQRWHNIVPLRLSVACLLCRPTLHSKCTISSPHALCKASLGDESILDEMSGKSNICPFINLDCCLVCDSILGAYIKNKEIIW